MPRAGGGGGHGRLLFGAAKHQRGCLPGCPILQGVPFVTFRVSHHRFMGCPVPQYGRFESFRVSDHSFMGCPIPPCGRFESFRVSRGPIPELRLCQQQIHRLSRYGCVLLCVTWCWKAQHTRYKMVGKGWAFCRGLLETLSTYGHRMGLVWHGTFQNWAPKFLPSYSGMVRGRCIEHSKRYWLRFASRVGC